MAFAPYIVEDAETVRSYLFEDPMTCAYMLGNLEGPYRRFSTFYGVDNAGGLSALVMSFSGFRLPLLVTFGSIEGLEQVMARFGPEMAGRTLLQIQPQQMVLE